MAKQGFVVFYFFLFFLFISTSTKTFSQNCTVNANVDFDICENEALTLEGIKNGLFENGEITWVQVGGPTAIIESPSSLSTNVLSILGGNIYSFRLMTTCEDGSLVFDDISITVLPASDANAGIDQELCPGTSAGTLNANSLLTGETGEWTIVGDNDAGLTIVDSDSSTSSINLDDNKSGTTTLRWTVTNPTSGCESFDEVAITNYGGVDPVSAGSDQILSECYSGTQNTDLTGSFAGSGLGGQTGTWSVVSGPNIPTFANASNNTSNVFNLIEGTYILRWTVSGSCVYGSDEIQITVPTAAGSVTNSSIKDRNPIFCDTRTSVVLNGSQANYENEIVFWEQIKGPSGVNIVNSTSPTTQITGLDGSSTYKFRYTITNTITSCYSTKTTQIKYEDAPEIELTTTDPLILNCGSTTANIIFTQSGLGDVYWSIIDGPTVSNYKKDNSSPITISNLATPGTYTVRIRKDPGGTSCDAIYKDIRVIVSSPPTSSTAGTNQLLECNVFNTALAGNPPSVGIGQWTQVSGPNQATITDPSSNISPISDLINGTYLFRWIITGGPYCDATQSDVEVVVASVTPNHADAGTDQSDVCIGTPVFLEGDTPVLNEWGEWTVSPSDDVVFSDTSSPNAIVNGLHANTEYTFIWTIYNSCGNKSDDVIINTNSSQGPIQAEAGDDQCLSSGTTSITLNGNDPSPGTGTWTKLSGPSATITDDTQYNSIVTDLTDGTYEFEWVITYNCAVPTRDTVLITISENASIANAGADQDVCGNSTTLTGIEPTTGSGTWTQVAGPGGAIINNPTSATSTIDGFVDGVYTFRWTITNGACGSNYDEVTLYVSAEGITDPAAGDDQDLCGVSSTNMEANVINSGEGYWSITEASNTPIISDVNSPTTEISNLNAGTYTFRWNAVGGSFCDIKHDDVTINVIPAANAGSDNSYCDVSSINLSGNDASTGTWSFVSGPNTPTINATASNAAVATNIITGVYTFKYTISAGGSCGTPSEDEVSIEVFSTTNASDAGSDQDLCGATNFTLSANTPSGSATGDWKKIFGPSEGSFDDDSDPNTQFTGATYGTYIFRWTISNTSCESSDEITIVNSEEPSDANAGEDQTGICGTSTLMNANSPSVGLGQWSLISKPGAAPDPVFASIISHDTEVTGLVPGNYTFRWTISNGSCTDKTDDVSITALQTPTQANAGADQEHCNVTSFTLDATNLSAGTGNWTYSGSHSGSFTDISDPKTTFTEAEPGTYIFKWTTTEGICTSEDEVEIINYALPSSAAAGDDQNICLFETMALAATPPTIGTGTWTQTSGSTAVILSPTLANSTIIGASAGSYEFTWTVSNGTCDSSSDAVTINVSPIPTMAVAGADQGLYEQNTITLSANTPSVGTGIWSIVSGGGTITSPNSPTTTVTSAPLVVNEFKWTIETAGCSSSDNVIVDNTLQPKLSINDVSTTEGGNLVFTVSLDHASGQTITADYESSDNLAKTSDNDYSTVTGSLEFLAGETSKIITIETNEDGFNEANETMYLNLSNASHATFANNQGVGTITDNDPQPSISIDDVSINEGGDLIFTVSLSHRSYQEIEVDYTSADQTAKLVDTDYTNIATSTLTFAAEETSKTITVSTNADTHFEEDETMLINLSDPSNASVLDNQGVGTITNEDDVPEISITDDSTVEGSQLSFTISLSNRSYQTITLDYESADGTAISSESDYTPISTTSLTFNPEETSKTIKVNSTTDDIFEDDEELTIELSNETNSTIRDAQGIGTITNDDNAPVVDDIYKSGTEDTDIFFELTDFTDKFSDDDGDDLYKIIVLSLPANGILKLDGSPITIDLEIDSDDLHKIVFSPDEHWNGETQFNWNGFDGDNYAIIFEQVFITIGAVNDIPQAFNDNKETQEDTPVSGNILDNDYDIDGDNLTVVQFKINGSTHNSGTSIAIENVGEIIIKANGSYTFSPALNYHGQIPTIDYTLKDEENKNASANLNIIVTPVNDPPVAEDDSAITNEDSPLSGTLFNNDYDVDGDIIKVTSYNINEITYLKGELANIEGVGSILISDDGDYDFIPNLNFNGSVPTIYYSIEDTDGLSDPAILIIVVEPVNDTPIAMDDSYTTDENTPITENVISNDEDGDGGKDILAKSALTLIPSNGQVTLNENGTFTYTPGTDFIGNDQFEYEICDSEGLCDQASVFITIFSTNEPPTAIDDEFTIKQREILTSSIIINDSDPDGDNISVIVTPIKETENGELLLNEDGSFTYTPNSDFFGIDFFEYQLCDDGNPIKCDFATVTISVLELPPIAIHDRATASVDSPVQIQVTLNDSVSFNPETIIVIEDPYNGYTSNGSNGTITYSPNNDFTGEDSFIYEICDDYNQCDTAIVYITIDDLLVPYEVFTPNGDGQNDTYVIEGAENYPNNRFVVFNRWGNIVYEERGYLNGWDGSSNSSYKIGAKPLPVGTYFYIFEYGNNKSKTGYIYIKR